jgi:hypothetical protein
MAALLPLTEKSTFKRHISAYVPALRGDIRLPERIAACIFWSRPIGQLLPL